MARAWLTSCEAFSSSVIRETRSLALSAASNDGLRNGAFARSEEELPGDWTDCWLAGVACANTGPVPGMLARMMRSKFFFTASPQNLCSPPSLKQSLRDTRHRTLSPCGSLSGQTLLAAHRHILPEVGA